MAGKPLKRLRLMAAEKLAKGEPLTPEEEAAVNGVRSFDQAKAVAAGREDAPAPVYGSRGKKSIIHPAVQALLEKEVPEPPGSPYSHVAVQEMARAGVPDTDIATLIGVDVKRMRQDADHALKVGRTQHKLLLRIQQMAGALAGDRTLLVWLGKQSLGQMDKMQAEHTGKDGGPIEHLHAVKSVRERLRKLAEGGIATAEEIAVIDGADAAPVD
jgi:hypothetical protein